MIIPEDVKKYAAEGDVIKKSDKQFEGYDIYHIYNEKENDGFPIVILKKDTEVKLVDMSDSKNDVIWSML